MSSAMATVGISAEGPKRRRADMSHHRIGSDHSFPVFEVTKQSAGNQPGSPGMLSATTVGLYSDYNDAYDIVRRGDLGNLAQSHQARNAASEAKSDVQSSAPALSNRSKTPTVGSTSRPSPTPRMSAVPSAASGPSYPRTSEFLQREQGPSSPVPPPARLVGTVWDSYMDYPSGLVDDMSPSPPNNHRHADREVELSMVDPLLNLVPKVRKDGASGSRRASAGSSQRPVNVVLPAENLIPEGSSRYWDPTLTHLPMSKDREDREEYFDVTHYKKSASRSNRIDIQVGRQQESFSTRQQNVKPSLDAVSYNHESLSRYDSKTLETLAPLPPSSERAAGGGESLNAVSPSHQEQPASAAPMLSGQDQIRLGSMSASDDYLAFYRKQFARLSSQEGEKTVEKKAKKDHNHASDNDSRREKKVKKDKKKKSESPAASDDNEHQHNDKIDRTPRTPNFSASYNNNQPVSAPSLSGRRSHSAAASKHHHQRHHQHQQHQNALATYSQSPSYDFRTEDGSEQYNSSITFYEDEEGYDEAFALHKREAKPTPQKSGQQRAGSQHSPRGPLQYQPQPSTTSSTGPASQLLSYDKPLLSTTGAGLDGYQHTPLDSALSLLPQHQQQQQDQRQRSHEGESNIDEGPSVFNRLYATGVISAARNELKHQRAVAEREKVEEEEALHACTFHPNATGRSTPRGTPRAGTPRIGARPMTPVVGGYADGQDQREHGDSTSKQLIVVGDDGTADKVDPAEVFRRLANEAISRRKRQEKRVADQAAKNEKAVLLAQQKPRSSSANGHLTAVPSSDIPLHERLYKQAMSRRNHFQKLADRTSGAKDAQCTFEPELIFKTNPASAPKPHQRSHSRNPSPSQLAHQEQASRHAINHPPITVSTSSQSTNVVGNVNGFAATVAGPGAIVPFSSPNKRLSAAELAEKEKQRERLVAMATRARERQAQRCELMAKKDQEEAQARHLEHILLKERAAARSEMDKIKVAIARQERFNAQLAAYDTSQKGAAVYGPKHHATLEELIALGI